MQPAIVVLLVKDHWTGLRMDGTDDMMRRVSLIAGCQKGIDPIGFGWPPNACKSENWLRSEAEPEGLLPFDCPERLLRVPKFI